MINPKPLNAHHLEGITALIGNRKISRIPIDLQKAERFIFQASQAVAELPALRIVQMKFDCAYNVIHDLGEATLAAYGFRTSNGVGQHVVGDFLVLLTTGGPYSTYAEDISMYRNFRNQIRYSGNPIGSIQAAEAVIAAQELFNGVSDLLEYSNK